MWERKAAGEKRRERRKSMTRKWEKWENSLLLSPSSLHHHCYLSSVAAIASKRRGAKLAAVPGRVRYREETNSLEFFFPVKNIFIYLPHCMFVSSYTWVVCGGVGVCELLLFCFFTCFECNCLFGFPCPLCSFVNLGRVLSGRCLGVFLGCLSICFLFQINSNPSTYIWERSSHQEFWGLLLSSPFGSFCLLGSVGLLAPRFVSGSEEQAAKSVSSRSHGRRRRSHAVCVFNFLEIYAVVDCHVIGLTWKVSCFVSAKKEGEGRRALPPILFLATGQSDRQEGEAVSLACWSWWCLQDKSGGGGGSDGIEFIGGGVLWR